MFNRHRKYWLKLFIGGIFAGIIATLFAHHVIAYNTILQVSIFGIGLNKFILFGALAGAIFGAAFAMLYPSSNFDR
jgi:hypothetical protein